MRFVVWWFCCLVVLLLVAMKTDHTTKALYYRLDCKPTKKYQWIKTTKISISIISFVFIH